MVRPRGLSKSRRAAAVAAMAIALAALAGCGGDDEGDGDGGGDTATTRLELTLDPDGPGGEPLLRRELVCETGDEDRACTLAADVSTAALAPVPPNTACTKIYGGAHVATMEGLLEGEPVDARFSREDGCEIPRFNAVAPLLGEVFPEYVDLMGVPTKPDGGRSG